jgi:hypothetical protein
MVITATWYCRKWVRPQQHGQHSNMVLQQVGKTSVILLLLVAALHRHRAGHAGCTADVDPPVGLLLKRSIPRSVMFFDSSRFILANCQYLSRSLLCAQQQAKHGTAQLSCPAANSRQFAHSLSMHPCRAESCRQLSMRLVLMLSM